MMQAIHVGARVIPIICGSIYAVSSGVKVYNLYRISQQRSLNREEKIELCMEVAMVFFQSADICLGIARSHSAIMKTNNAEFLKALHLVTSGGTGVIHITKEMMALHNVKDLSAWGQVLGIVLFRISNFTEVAASAPVRSTHILQRLETVTDVASIVGGGLYVIVNKDEVKSAAQVIAKWAQKLFSRSKGQEDDTLLFFPDIENQDQIEPYFDDLYESVQDWKNLTQIPEELCVDPVLSTFKCKITDQCVRFVVTPRRPKGLCHGIYYEKAKIEEWLLNNQTPPGWPIGLNFDQQNISENTAIQKVINKRLKAIAAEWQENKGVEAIAAERQENKKDVFDPLNDDVFDSLNDEK